MFDFALYNLSSVLGVGGGGSGDSSDLGGRAMLAQEPRLQVG